MRKINKTLDMFIHIFGAAFLFMTVGYYTPRFYYRHIDTRPFLQLDIPLSIEKKTVQPCEKNELIMTRHAKENLSSTISVQMVLETLEGDKIVQSYSYETIISEGQKTVRIPYETNCEAENGTYFYYGIVRYEQTGLEQFVPFYTEKFTVEASSSAR